MTDKKPLIVTTSWDDGTKSDLKLAEILEKHRVKGTFYLSRGKNFDLLRPEDIVALGGRFGIGAHTLTHPDLTTLSPEKAREEIVSSKAYLESLLKRPVEMFCYPGGSYNPAIIEYVKQAGFLGARTCLPDGFNFPADFFQWHMTFLASNGSPLMALKICAAARLVNPGALFDWETRGRLLFDRALESGGVYHIYGHSQELEDKQEWGKMNRLLAYVSGKNSVLYLDNSEVLEYAKSHKA